MNLHELGKLDPDPHKKGTTEGRERSQWRRGGSRWSRGGPLNQYSYRYDEKQDLH